MKFTLALMASTALLMASAQSTNRIDVIRPDAPALAAYGKHTVGVRTLQLVNPNQVNVLGTKAGEANQTYDRPLTVEVWYPARPLEGGPAVGRYETVLRDGKTPVALMGRALRYGVPDASGGPYPLVIVSHGYPGNRMLLAPLAENLASKGYVVASIDHTDSTYSDQAAFGSTLLNRPIDQAFVLSEMARLNNERGFLQGMVNAENTALVGYSMGGYGVVNSLGGGFTEASTKLPFAPPNNLLQRRMSGNPEYTKSLDSRIKAAIAIAPWGWNAGFWNPETLKGIETPIMFVAGSADDVSGYAPGVRSIYENAVNADRYLLTFENANHNAAAPMPAPREAFAPNAPFAHYADAVWDTVRMNNIMQHFATAYLGKHLKGDATMDAYLNVVPNARDGRWSAEKDGTFKSDHTYWTGFPNRTALGLRLERLAPAK